MSLLHQIHPNAIHSELARRHLLDFTTFTFPGYRVNWHHRVMCEALDRLVFGDLRRLMIFTPPRHGKSELVSRRLPAFFMGNNPDAEVILATYGADLSNRMNLNVQQIMDSPEYRNVFPHVRLPGGVGEGPTRRLPGAKKTRTNDYFEVVGSRGSLRSVGVGGGITGMGFNLGIIDDPLKDAEEAMSQVIRDKIWDWYTSTFWTRQTGFGASGASGGESQARILLTMTRWNDDDLAGRLLQLAAEDKYADQWEVLILPGMSEDVNLSPQDLRDGPDQALWEDSIYNSNFMQSAKHTLPDYFWSAVYQQRPRRKGGAYFDRTKFGHFTIDGNTIHVPGRAPCKIQDCFIWAGVDFAASEKQKADFSVIVVLCQTPDGDCLILDVKREKHSPVDIPNMLRRTAREWPIAFYAAESDGFQIGVVDAARKLDGMPPIREVKHQGKGKLVRATKAIVRCENRELYVPKEAPWKNKFFDELEVFTGDDDRHDDQVDALAHGIHQFGRDGVISSVEVDHGKINTSTQEVPRDRQMSAGRRRLYGMH